MCYAKTAANYITGYCRFLFPDRADEMGSTMANGSLMDVFDHRGYGSHKYIPADRLTQELGMREGAGVYGYWAMSDDSYLLLTCAGTLAWWSGKTDEPAQWNTLSLANK